MTKEDMTKMRSLRLGDIWNRAMNKAYREGRTLTEVVDTKLHEFVDEDVAK